MVSQPNVGIRARAQLGFTICTVVHVVMSKNHLELFDFKLKIRSGFGLG